jgi:hypothetical protein
MFQNFITMPQAQNRTMILHLSRKHDTKTYITYKQNTKKGNTQVRHKVNYLIER